jgi:hypothetical protein
MARNTHEARAYYISYTGEQRSRQLDAGTFEHCRQVAAAYARQHGEGSAGVEELEPESPEERRERMRQDPYFT